MIYALVTRQGTAMPETALCDEHEKDEDCRFTAFAHAPHGGGRDDTDEDALFVDCTNNELLACIICGKS
jgi:hypothetical protein